MANDSYSQQRLAQDPIFQGRIRSALSVVAWQVLGEDVTTPNHDKRIAFARQTLTNLTFGAQSIAPWMVERPNLQAFATSYDFESGAVVTAAADADLQSQLMTDWDVLSGV
jgi:hypothetical protein